MNTASVRMFIHICLKSGHWYVWEVPSDIIANYVCRADLHPRKLSYNYKWTVMQQIKHVLQSTHGGRWLCSTEKFAPKRLRKQARTFLPSFPFACEWGGEKSWFWYDRLKFWRPLKGVIEITLGCVIIVPIIYSAGMLNITNSSKKSSHFINEYRTWHHDDCYRIISLICILFLGHQKQDIREEIHCNWKQLSVFVILNSVHDKVFLLWWLALIRSLLPNTVNAHIYK